jgi:hypothetical protein
MVQEAFLNRIWFTALVQEGYRPSFLESKIDTFLMRPLFAVQAIVREPTRGKIARRRDDENAIGTVKAARAEAHWEAGIGLSKPQ